MWFKKYHNKFGIMRVLYSEGTLYMTIHVKYGDFADLYETHDSLMEYGWALLANIPEGCSSNMDDRTTSSLL